jgi:His/Glu/Gln/Arg/opine family amino acid ABC transporter permease subunit
MHIDGYILQILLGTIVTIKLALCAAIFGMTIGLIGAILESIPSPWLRYPAASLIFVIRGLPELLVLFFIYFGATIIISKLFKHYVDISAFAAGVIALGLIFGAYASQFFRDAFLAIDHGQIEAGKAIGFTRLQIFTRIQIPQAWRHAIPGLGNLWLVLLKDTAIVTLIGLTDMMNQAKIAASTTHQPFTFYFIAAGIYLLITSVSQKVINLFTVRANRYIPEAFNI